MLYYNTKSEILKAGISGNEKVSFNDIDAASIVGKRGWNPAVAAGEGGTSLAEGDVIVIAPKSEVAVAMVGDNAWYFVPCQHYSADGTELPVYNFSLSYYRKAVFGVRASSNKATKVDVYTSKGNWRKAALTCGDYKEFFEQLFGSTLKVVGVTRVKATPFVAADDDSQKRYKLGQVVQPEEFAEWKESNVYDFDVVKDDVQDAVEAQQPELVRTIA